MKKPLRQLGKTVVATTMALSVLAGPVSYKSFAAGKPDKAGKHEVQLRIMGTTDIHTHLYNYDYYKDAPTNEFGLAKTATLIKQARAEKEGKNNLLFDNGDLIQGNPLGDYKAKVDVLEDGEMHPVFEAMELLDYDAATVGNHEFNYGLDYLDEVLDDAPMPYVNANVFKDDGDDNPDNDENYFKPYTIFNKKVTDNNGKTQVLKVGVVGAVTPQILQWDKANLDGKVITKDIVKSVEAQIPKMKEEGADIIIALSHSGIGDEKVVEMEENAAYDLSLVDGIDAIITGHNHLTFPGSFTDLPGVDPDNGTINGVPVVMAGNWGNQLGVMDITIAKEKGKWNVKNSKSELRAIYDKGTKTPLVEADKEILEAVKEDHEGTVNYVRQPVGETAADINSYFALVQDDPSIQIVTNAQKWYVEKQVKGTSDENLPILSAGAPFKSGRGGVSDYTYIPKGTIAIKNVADLYLYPNTVSTIKIKGSDVKEWLEMSAGQFNQIDENITTEQPLINPKFPVYNYDVIDGVTYEIDVTEPAKYDDKGNLVDAGANRIKNLQYNGQPIDLEQEFLVVTNNYRATGSFPGVVNQTAVEMYPDENRQAIIDYIREVGTIDPSADNNWSFAGVSKDLNVTFNSTPDAQNALPESGLINYAGEAANGFAKYQLHLPIGLQLLGINDFHGQLDTYNSKINAGGVDYLAAYLKEREATNPNTLMLHAGDAVGASSPVSALLQDEPTIKILNKIGFDAGTVGNHEFDEGVEEMLRLIDGGSHPKTVDKYGEFEGADFPYLAANLVYKETGENVLDPYTVIDVNGIPVGIIGVALSDTPSIVIPSAVTDVKFTDEAEAINRYTEELKAQGVETIVVLAHNPSTSKPDGSNAGEELVEIAQNVDDEVDVLMGGHNHAFTNTKVDGKIVVQSYSSGTAFSDVDLLINPVTKDVMVGKSEIVTTYRDKIQPDAEIKAMLDSYVADVAPILNEVIGTTPSYISRDTSAAGESAMGNLVADSMRWQTGTDFAFMNSGGVRADIDAGDITWKEAFTVQPFGNDLVKMNVTGEVIKTLLEQQWGSKVRIMPISGLKVAYDDSRAAGDRIVSITKNDGTPVEMDKTYSITVNNYMAGGGDGYAILATITDKTIDVVDLDALVNYIKAHGEVNPQIEGRVTKLN
ncbi:bifunctional 2',3'-cyclic-nucleotide 2'-phosphodiesterase/3'-nucleotidase [Mesobacillus sp. AQ2]|uniref:bifunctional 2',3'-cyclic-nucleotide 2'-phosphodiesterase/3'-nucleotidase n=1 Tax=Bacillaceae TaxID=186817 RepID=UPI00203CBE9B|nr:MULTISPECIES: bifunctional 2',3'-cyclic-nucleotide 2'-phosphodiesterase/3'-nucleotidase [Bacillaceae]MCM3125474.1 bifunctional 2',3'-cyclic-nucleotide 2'-phosphodiesterase/3'-nucleotidase [Mesobacillus sp. MER 33]MCM3234482.1 bifunctional 2',3'-cyclic-nucleotide 2'-phosphodiesterase/3'-nucleotidase [Mesobacillus sp. MER 48]WHX41451.1 bifunctional 2',3'-cyclic-nucleotide 2'-phosphodiesterase/3'-nucleotidase [Mesobacillus sp. AQ2]